jgi:hypothetical protein
MKIDAKINGKKVVASGTLTLSDEYNFDLQVEDVRLSFVFISDESAKGFEAKSQEISSNHAKILLINASLMVSFEIEKIISDDDPQNPDLSLGLMVQTIDGKYTSRLVSYSLWEEE